MKSTYKLFGIIYDKLPETKEKYVIAPLNNILDIVEERCLFDDDKYIRKINLSFLLSIESKEKIDLILNIASKLDEVILVLDVASNNQIIKAFIDKRTKQILWLLENKCRQVSVSQ